MFINLTPHPVTLLDTDNNIVREIPSSGNLRCSKTQVPDFVHDGVQVNRTKYGECPLLPEPKADTFYIVSSLLKSAHPEREDFLVPDDVVRDENFRIIGCRAFSR